MNPFTDSTATAVLPEEGARRIAEYRRMGFEHQAMPHVIYHGQWILCPWPGCGYSLAGIDFQLEPGNPAQYAAFLAAWWQGRGLVGRCPGCHQYVLFTFQDKQCVADPRAVNLSVLPDDWFTRAYINL